MAGKGTRRRIEISRVEMAGIIAIVTAGLGGAFILGLYAGRGMNDRRLPVTGQVVRLPVAPAVERSPDGERELTFYETLEPHGPKKGDGQREGKEGPATTPPTEAVQPAAGPATPRPERTPVPPVARPTVVVVPSSVPAPPARGEWSVQVTATRDPRTADGLAQRLRAKGYEAYVVKMARQDGVFYRVRVGHYASLEEANKMVSRLRREPGVPEAFVASN